MAETAMRKGFVALVLSVGAVAGMGAGMGDARVSAEEAVSAERGAPDSWIPAAERPEDREPVERESPKPPAERISLKDATEIVRQAYGGRIVSAEAAEARPSPNRPKENGFRIRVDVDGRVKTVFVDGRGRIHERAQF